MYKYFDKNENDDISLHDCRATNASLENGILSFVFADGFCILIKGISQLYLNVAFGLMNLLIAESVY